MHFGGLSGRPLAFGEVDLKVGLVKMVEMLITPEIVIVDVTGLHLGTWQVTGIGRSSNSQGSRQKTFLKH